MAVLCSCRGIDLSMHVHFYCAMCVHMYVYLTVPGTMEPYPIETPAFFEELKKNSCSTKRAGSIQPLTVRVKKERILVGMLRQTSANKCNICKTLVVE
jgi:hypothetical protein